MVAAALRDEFGWAPRLHDPDLAVAKGAALRAHRIVTLASVDGPAAPRRPAGEPPAATVATATQPASVVPRSFGLLVADSYEPSGARRFVDHVIRQNEPLPVTGRDTTVSTIVDNQTSIRIEVYEQAGAVESDVVANNRRVLDGELTGLPEGLPAGTPIRVTLRLGLDGRLRLTAVEPATGATLSLEAYIDGVLDTPGREQVARGLRMLTIRQ
jgi:molecular chaperone DnaK (HSP70)